MEDENKPQETKEEQKEESKPMDLVQRATLERQELEKISTQVAQQLKELKELKAQNILSGNSLASTEEKKEDVDPVEYAKKLLG